MQELAFTLANAISVLDAVREAGDIAAADFPQVVGRMSFFLNAGIRFIEEMCKVRVFSRMWDRICRERYGVQDPGLRRFRYGVQVNSLGLTDRQPENNIARILYEFLGRRAEQVGPRALRAASRLERGPRASPPVGPAVEPADSADPGP
ncbi:MAG: methylmalonyl-CoA mutase family protein [Desulfobacterales bacterium]|nr:methylmalonyl-CoA mutase family protein [Desulfobacterales bacterium]